MSRLVDPLLCPDCRGRVLPGGRCSSCGLMLNGPEGQRLFRVLMQADDIVEGMRAAQRGQPMAPPPMPGTALPFPAPSAPPRPHLRLPSTTGRSLVLMVAVLLIFVAGSLFLAVAWAVMPLAVKALVMLGITALFGTLGWWLNRTGLRGSAEAVWGLTAALVALDISAAHRSGLLNFDAVDGRHVAGVTGLLLVSLGVPAALWAMRSATRRSIAAEVVVVVGVFAMLVGWAFQGAWNDGPQQAVAVPLVAGLALTLRSRLRWVSWGVLGLTALTWLVLILTVAPYLGVARTAYWSHLRGWPLVVGAVYAGGLAFVPRIPLRIRQLGAGAALAVIALLIVVPLHPDSLEILLLALAVVLVAAAHLLPSQVWSAPAQWVGLAVATLGALVLATLPWNSTALFAFERIYSSPTTSKITWSAGPQGWTLIALGLAAGFAAAALQTREHQGMGRRLTWGVAPVAYAVAGATTDAGWRLPLPVAALAVAAVLGGAVALNRQVPTRSWWSLIWAGLSAGLAIDLASANDVVTAVVATGFALVVGAVAWRERSSRLDWLLGGLLVVLLSHGAVAWVHAAGGHAYAQAVTLALLTAAILVTWRWAPGRLRIGLEIASAIPGLAAIAFAASRSADTVALAITVIGSALTLNAISAPRRTALAWPAAGFLAIGTALRFYDHVPLPESYCLPAAAILIGAGGWRLRTNREESSWRVLAAGLSLLLVPSLLIAMDHPGSIRSVLVALGAALALTVGIALRWQAPLLVGSGVLIALALRFLLPLARDLLANPFGPWVLFGALGMACLLIGILWEQTHSGVRRASHYVGTLR